MRRRPVAVLAALIAAAAALSSPIDASAAGSALSSMTTVPGHPELIVATVAAGVEMSDVTATIATPDGDQQVALEQQGTTSTWQSQPVRLTGLGLFPTTVVATPADGSDPSTGSFTLRYLKQPVVDTHALTGADPMRFDDHTVTASGRLLTRDPRSDATSPAAGEQVHVYNSFGETPSTTTAADGSYTLTADVASTRLPATWDTTVTVGWLPTSDPLLDLTSAVVIDRRTVTQQRSVGRIVFDQNAPVDYPAKAPVSGQVQRRVGNVWVPTPGVQVSVEQWNFSVLVATTDGDGRFSFLVSNRGREQVEFGVQARDGDGSTLLERDSSHQPVVRSLVLPVRDRSHISFPTRPVAADSTLQVGGQLRNLGPAEDQTSVSSQRLYLEQSTNGTTGWHTLGYLVTDKWSNAGRFEERAFLEHPSGYVRLTFKGNAVLQPTHSQVVRVSRIDTRIYLLNASPEPVRAGAPVAVRGIVQRLSGSSWVHLGRGHQVQVFFRAKGSSHYTYQGYTRTTSSGGFRFNGKARSDGYWTAVWFTSSHSYVNAYGSDDYVDVR